METTTKLNRCNWIKVKVKISLQVKEKKSKFQRRISNWKIASLYLENIQTYNQMTTWTSSGLTFSLKLFLIESHTIHDMSLKFLLKEDFAVEDNLVNIRITHIKLTALEDYVLDATIAMKLLILLKKTCGK